MRPSVRQSGEQRRSGFEGATTKRNWRPEMHAMNQDTKATLSVQQRVLRSRPFGDVAADIGEADMSAGLIEVVPRKSDR
jgi:hypothetical protein